MTVRLSSDSPMEFSTTHCVVPLFWLIHYGSNSVNFRLRKFQNLRPLTSKSTARKRRLEFRLSVKTISSVLSFLSKPQAWYRRSQARYSVASLLTSTHEVRCISSARRAGYHHAQACIPLRLDDIQHFVLMISNFCKIDDIHAVA